MKKHTIRFDLRYRQSHMIGIGSVAICNLFIWAYYWLTQSKKTVPGWDDDITFCDIARALVSVCISLEDCSYR